MTDYIDKKTSIENIHNRRQSTEKERKSLIDKYKTQVNDSEISYYND
jgi:hypothetical protein